MWLLEQLSFFWLGQSPQTLESTPKQSFRHIEQADVNAWFPSKPILYFNVTHVISKYYFWYEVGWEPFTIEPVKAIFVNKDGTFEKLSPETTFFQIPPKNVKLLQPEMFIHCSIIYVYEPH